MRTRNQNIPDVSKRAENMNRVEIIFSKVTFDSDEELSPAERKKVEKMQERQAKAVARCPIMIMRMTKIRWMRMRMIGMIGMKRMMVMMMIIRRLIMVIVRIQSGMKKRKRKDRRRR